MKPSASALTAASRMRGESAGNRMSPILMFSLTVLA